LVVKEDKGRVEDGVDARRSVYDRNERRLEALRFGEEPVVDCRTRGDGIFSGTGNE